MQLGEHGLLHLHARILDQPGNLLEQLNGDEVTTSRFCGKLEDTKTTVESQVGHGA